MARYFHVCQIFNMADAAQAETLSARAKMLDNSVEGIAIVSWAEEERH